MEHEEIPIELTFDDLLTNDDSSTEKPLEQIIRSNPPQTKLTAIAQQKDLKINPATGKPVFIHNLAQTIKTTQNGNQVISRVIKNEGGSLSNTPVQIKTTTANQTNKKIIVLPAGKGQPVRVAGSSGSGNVQLVRSGNNVLTLKGQVVKVVSNSSPTTSTVTTTNTQKGLPPGAIIIKNVNPVPRPSNSTVTLKQVQVPKSAQPPKHVVKMSQSSSFQIKSVTTSNTGVKSEVTTPTKYTIVRNSNGQQIKIIPHTQSMKSGEANSKAIPMSSIMMSPTKETIIRSRPVPKEFIERTAFQPRPVDIPKPLLGNQTRLMVPPAPTNRVGKKLATGFKKQMNSDSEMEEEHLDGYQTQSFGFEKKFTIKKERSPSPEVTEIKRKHCNCSKSQCLKLYCDCFASGQFCQDCNCRDCSNNLEHEDDRQKAIKSCLERNPEAFKPKITASQRQSDLRLHNKGCNCKRSGCLKNYCECYEAKIACSSNCKCIGCKNTDDCGGRHFDPDMDAKLGRKRGYELPEVKVEAGEKQQPYNFITQEVIEASIQCMLAQAEDCKKSGKDVAETELKVIEEFGRCLVEIIAFSIKTSGGI